MKTIIASSVVVGVVWLGMACYVLPMAAPSRQPQPQAKIEQPAHTAKPHRGELPRTIVASGTVKPEEVVEVGAQVNGMITAFGPDPSDPSKPVDYGTFVHKGAVLAQIDPTIYKAQVDYAEASLAKAKAELLQLFANCSRLKQDWLRGKSLLPEKAIAPTDYELLAANFEMATGSVASGQAAVKQCEAALEQAKTYLSYTVITSPIDGVIIDRRVNVGQIVCASFNVPGLFLVAKDLQRVQVWASVDESDIGRIQPGSPVRYTLDAYPGDAFEGKVSQIRMNPTKTTDRTSYTVVVATNNSRGMLPYLTAKLHFEPASCVNAQLTPKSSPPSAKGLEEPPGKVLASR